MTFRSLFIEQYETHETATAPFAFGKEDHEDFGRLDDAAGTLWSFAKANNLEPDYVDNCWMRVAVDAAGLRRFLESALPHAPRAAELLTLVPDDKWFVINDEEF